MCQTEGQQVKPRSMSMCSHSSGKAAGTVCDACSSSEIHTNISNEPRVQQFSPPANVLLCAIAYFCPSDINRNDEMEFHTPALNALTS